MKKVWISIFSVFFLFCHSVYASNELLYDSSDQEACMDVEAESCFEKIFDRRSLKKDELYSSGKRKSPIKSKKTMLVKHIADWKEKQKLKKKHAEEELLIDLAVDQIVEFVIEKSIEKSIKKMTKQEGDLLVACPICLLVKFDKRVLHKPFDVDHDLCKDCLQRCLYNVPFMGESDELIGVMACPLCRVNIPKKHIGKLLEDPSVGPCIESFPRENSDEIDLFLVD